MDNQNDFGAQFDFDKMFQQSVEKNIVDSQKGYDVSDDRLKEMNKRLPAWNLEPPYSLLKQYEGT